MGSREYLTISNIVFTWIECYLYAIILIILKLSHFLEKGRALQLLNGSMKVTEFLISLE